jgi:hypothetical protein
MRLKVGVALLLCILLYTVPAQAQVIMAGPDSVIVATEPAEREPGFFLSRWDKPAKAAIFSAVLPGLGQAYNNSYWKIPIIYATGGVLGYFIISHNNNYQDYRQALIIRLDNDPNTRDKFADSNIFGEARPNGDANLRRARNFYRRNRDLTIILSVVAYSLNVAEAYVHAHLKDFDVSDNLAIRVQPDLLHTPVSIHKNITPGLSITLYTKAK